MKYPKRYIATLATLLSAALCQAEDNAFYFYGKADGSGLLSFCDASNWNPATVPPSDYSATAQFAAVGKSLVCSVDEIDPWKLGMLAVGTGVGPVTLEGNTLAFQNPEDGPKIFLICAEAQGEQSIANDILLEGNGGENTVFQFGGGEILLSGTIIATGPTLGLSMMDFPTQVVTIRGTIEDKTVAGLSLQVRAGRLALESVTNNFRGEVTIGVEETTELVATTVADAGKPSSIGSGSMIRFGLGFGKDHSEFTLKVIGSGPQSTNRNIEIVGNVDPSFSTNAVLLSEVAGEGVAFTGDIVSTRYKGDALLLLDGAGNGTFSGAVPSSIMGLQKRGSGTWTVSNPANAFSGEVSVENGELRLQGGTGTPLGGANVACSGKGILSGEGELQGSLIFAVGGRFLAGNGTLTVLGSLRFDAGSVFEFVPGAKGKIEAKEDVTLKSATFIVRNGEAAPSARGEVVLIKSDKPADGTFQGLPEGAAVKVGNASASISYKRGVSLKFP